ncbi:MAG: hypothetical protein HQL54_11050 [Magnetococcales bacterium]|nr:hypothetical protein [Magnetococcales bacterium]
MSESLEKLTVFIDTAHLLRRVNELAEQIELDFHNRKPVVLIMLKGGALFAADLMKALDKSWPMAYVSVRGSEQPWMSNEDKRLIRDRDLLIVDTLLDSGHSMKKLMEWLKPLQPASKQIAILLHKTVSDAEPLPIQYLGFEVPDVRLVGYGLDEDQLYRGRPAIYTWWEPQVISSGKGNGNN